MLHVALRGSQHISLVASNHSRCIQSRFVFLLKSICDSASPIFHFVAQSSSELLSSSASDRSAMGNRRRAATPLSWVSSGEKSCRWNRAQTFNCTIGEKQIILLSSTWVCKILKIKVTFLRTRSSLVIKEKVWDWSQINWNTNIEMSRIKSSGAQATNFDFLRKILTQNSKLKLNLLPAIPFSSPGPYPFSY